MMGGNMNKMMKQVQKMQANMLKMQEELSERTVESTVGGGVIKVVANGSQEIVSIDIQPEAVDPDDIEMLQEMILTATNDALQKAKDMVSSEMSKITGGLNIPGLF